MSSQNKPALIAAALKRLDPKNDGHWTADGLPRMDVIVQLLGDPSITRKEVTEAVPGFARENVGLLPMSSASEKAEPALVGDTLGDDAEPTDEELEDVAEGDAGEPDDLDADVPGDPDPECVLDMPLPRILGDYALTCRAIEEMRVRMDEGSRRKAAIVETLEKLSRMNELLKRTQVNFERANPHLNKGSNANAIRDYLEAQRQSREARAARAARFVKSGTSVEDVVDQLASGSKLDRAMRVRKVPRSAQRPAVQVPAS